MEKHTILLQLSSRNSWKADSIGCLRRTLRQAQGSLHMRRLAERSRSILQLLAFRGPFDYAQGSFFCSGVLFCSGILGESICSLDAGACYNFRPKNCMRNSCIGMLSVFRIAERSRSILQLLAFSGPFDRLRGPFFAQGSWAKAFAPWIPVPAITFAPGIARAILV